MKAAKPILVSIFLLVYSGSSLAKKGNDINLNIQTPVDIEISNEKPGVLFISPDDEKYLRRNGEDLNISDTKHEVITTPPTQVPSSAPQ